MHSLIQIPATDPPKEFSMHGCLMPNHLETQIYCFLLRFSDHSLSIDSLLLWPKKALSFPWRWDQKNLAVPVNWGCRLCCWQQTALLWHNYVLPEQKLHHVLQCRLKPNGSKSKLWNTPLRYWQQTLKSLVFTAQTDPVFTYNKNHKLSCLSNTIYLLYPCYNYYIHIVITYMFCIEICYTIII